MRPRRAALFGVKAYGEVRAELTSVVFFKAFQGTDHFSIDHTKDFFKHVHYETSFTCIKTPSKNIPSLGRRLFYRTSLTRVSCWWRFFTAYASLFGYRTSLKMPITSAIVGATFGAVSLCLLVFILSVLLVLIRRDFLHRKRNTVYILLIANVVVDAITVFQLCFYLTPSIIMQVGMRSDFRLAKKAFAMNRPRAIFSLLPGRLKRELFKIRNQPPSSSCESGSLRLTFFPLPAKWEAIAFRPSPFLEM